MNDELPDNLARAMKALDADASRAAERVNPDRVAERVIARLREAPAVEVAAPARRTWIRVAAALLLLLTGALLGRYALGPQAPVLNARTDLPVQAGDSLVVAQTDALLNAVEAVRTVSTDTVEARTVVSVEDLNETELRALLQSMASSEGES